MKIAESGDVNFLKISNWLRIAWKYVKANVGWALPTVIWFYPIENCIKIELYNLFQFICRRSSGWEHRISTGFTQLEVVGNAHPTPI